jgi:nicotinamidase-related amidase
MADLRLILAKAQAEDALIIYIRHEFDNLRTKLVSYLLLGGIGVKGNPDTQLDSRVPLLSEHIYGKGAHDSFSNLELDAFLRRNQVDELTLVGLDGAACVQRTAHGALNRGYRVNLIKNCILTRQPYHWEAALAELQKNKLVRVLDSGEYLSEPKSPRQRDRNGDHDRPPTGMKRSMSQMDTLDYANNA